MQSKRTSHILWQLSCLPTVEIIFWGVREIRSHKSSQNGRSSMEAPDVDISGESLATFKSSLLEFLNHVNSPHSAFYLNDDYLLHRLADCLSRLKAILKKNFFFASRVYSILEAPFLHTWDFTVFFATASTSTLEPIQALTMAQNA